MITPAFDLSQDADFLTMIVRVPYTRTSEFDIYIQGDDLKFFAKPYFLRLTLPGRIVEDGRERASFDVDKGLFTLRVPKEIAGQNFEGLEMLTSLLAPKGSRSAKPLVEEAETSEEGRAEACGEDEEDEEFDWQIEQEVYTETPEETLKKYHKYGFANLRSGVFSRLQDELNEVIDLKDPDHTAPELRRSLRLDAETAMFCPDHYLGNLYEDEEEIKTLLKFKPWWTELNDSVTFTDEEKEQMRKFTNRSYPLDKKARFRVWLGLVDILLAYVYDVRTTEGEHNVESAWTIRKLSGTLIWLETYHSVQDVLVAFGRRTLCYPLFRHFSLVTKAVKDVAGIFQSGKACVLRCLLAIHKIFRENDPAYILNDLFITDYCIWIQKVKSKHVMALAEPLHKAKLQKCDLDLELEILEQAAELVVMEEEEEEEEEEEDSSSEESEEADSTSLDLQKHGETPAAETMMEELRGRLEAGLTIQEDVPRERQPVRGERESERSADADDSRHSAAKPASSAELLHPPLRKNPLLVVAAGDLDSDDEEDDDDDDDLMAARP